MTGSEVDQRYPTGRFRYDGDSSREAIDRSIQAIASLPGLFRKAVTGLNDEQLDTPYRDGGWTVRQVVHHVPDSHMHAYLRCKLALTEDTPTIKPYDEATHSYTATYLQEGRELALRHELVGARGIFVPSRVNELVGWLRLIGTDNVKLIVLDQPPG